MSDVSSDDRLLGIAPAITAAASDSPTDLSLTRPRHLGVAAAILLAGDLLRFPRMPAGRWRLPGPDRAIATPRAGASGEVGCPRSRRGDSAGCRTRTLRCSRDLLPDADLATTCLSGGRLATTDTVVAFTPPTRWTGGEMWRRRRIAANWPWEALHSSRSASPSRWGGGVVFVRATLRGSEAGSSRAPDGHDCSSRRSLVLQGLSDR